MSASLLSQINSTPAQVAALSAEQRQRVVEFLIRWEAYPEALACIDGASRADTAHLLDLRAQILHGLGRTAEAIAALSTRLQQQDALPARIELARLYLAAQNTDAALQIAEQLTRGDAGTSPAWTLMAEVRRARGEVPAAEALYLRQLKAAPLSRQPLFGLMQLHWDAGNLVVASAYAIKALDLTRRTTELSVAEISRLRSFFHAVNDPNRLDQLNQQLYERFDRERNEIVAMLQAATPAAAVLTRARVGIGRLPGRPLPSAPPAPPAIAAPPPVGVTATERTSIQKSAHKLFGFPALLPHQAEVIACVRRGDHVLAILPTGAGKSLCYQLPAFDQDGLTLVVSPLIALMKDQLDGLPDALRRQAVAVNSTLDGDSLRNVLERIAAGKVKLVYAAPERLRQLPFLHMLRHAGLVRMVVDEAHCVSVWGHDFRPDYLHLAQAHQDLGAPPLLAMTATAPPGVRQDIERQLFGQAGQPRLVVGDTFRPNLQLSALCSRDDDEQFTLLVALAQQLNGPGIIYARSRQRCEELAHLLRTHGITAAHYHAGIPDRSEVHDRFMRNEYSVIVATVAFGMGVDKPDLRYIVHFGLPNSLDGYYQEIGRAGRDGKPAQCILLYTAADRGRLERLAAQDHVNAASVRAVLAALGAQLPANQPAVVDLGQLAKVAENDEVAVRSIIGLLEQVGSLRRHYDIPRTLTVIRRTHTTDPDAARFFQRAGLIDTHQQCGEFCALSQATQLPLSTLESHLLDWQERKLIRYYPAGRQTVVTLLPPPRNAAQQIESALQQRAVIAQQRIKEIADFAETRACRHGYLAGYLGGEPRKQCNVCDNCGAPAPIKLVPAPAVANDAVHVVLLALAQQSWGKRTLIRLLRGDPAASDRAQQSSYYGALRERTEQSLAQLLDSLLAEQLITLRELDHGGVTLELTRQGSKALRNAKR